MKPKSFFRPFGVILFVTITIAAVAVSLWYQSIRGGRLALAIRNENTIAIAEEFAQVPKSHKIVDAYYDGICPTTPLTYAVMLRKEAAAAALLKSSADPNELDQYGRPALYFAILNDDVLLVDLLLSAGADINVGHGSFFPYSSRAMMLAERWQSVNVISYLEAKRQDASSSE